MKNRPILLLVSPAVNKLANSPSQAMNRQVINHPAIHRPVIHRPVIRHPVIHLRRQRNRVDHLQGRALKVKSRTLVNRESRVNLGSQAVLLMTRILVRLMVKKVVVKQARVTLARMYYSVKKKTASIRERGSISYWTSCGVNVITPTKSCSRRWAGTNSG